MAASISLWYFDSGNGCVGNEDGFTDSFSPSGDEDDDDEDDDDDVDAFLGLDRKKSGIVAS